MDNQQDIQQKTPQEKKIIELEEQLLTANKDIESLMNINLKLGYSTRLLTEFHMSKEEKLDFAETIDAAKDSAEVKKIYETYNKAFFNESLDDELDEFQWLPGFKEKIRHYFAVSLGYDIVSEIGDNLSLIASYFTLENKIRNTPDAAVRKPMTEKLLKDREATLIAMDNIINIINSFNDES